MSEPISTRRALPTTLLLHALQGALGMAVATSLGLELERGAELDALPRTLRVASLEHLLALLPLLRSKLLDVGLLVALTALLSPWLQTAWLAALTRMASPLRALRAGLSGAPRALAASLWVASLGALLCGPFLALGHVLFHRFAGSFDPRTHLLLVGASLAPLPLLGAWLLVVNDLARAGCLREPALRSVRGAVRLSVRPRQLLAYAGWSLLGQGAALLSVLVTGPGQPLSPWMALGLAHALLLGRSLARSAWLAHALRACAPARAAPGGSGDNPDASASEAAPGC